MDDERGWFGGAGVGEDVEEVAADAGGGWDANRGVGEHGDLYVEEEEDAMWGFIVRFLWGACGLGFGRR